MKLFFSTSRIYFFSHIKQRFWGSLQVPSALELDISTHNLKIQSAQRHLKMRRRGWCILIVRVLISFIAQIFLMLVTTHIIIVYQQANEIREKCACITCEY